MNTLKKSPKTTAGAIAILVALVAGVAQLLLDGDPATNPDWALVVPVALTSLAFLAAKDEKGDDS